jgi:hypothetical protein
MGTEMEHQRPTGNPPPFRFVPPNEQGVAFFEWQGKGQAICFKDRNVNRRISIFVKLTLMLD